MQAYICLNPRIMNESKKIWFKAKNYGWGWQPSSWQGWLVLLVFIGFNIKIFWLIDRSSHSVSDTLINFVLPFILSTVILIIICYFKGEKPKWRWGK